MAPEPDEERRARRRWTTIIVGFIGFNIVAASVLLLFATRDDPSHHVEKDYYRKALAWDKTMAEQRRATELGWRLSLELLPTERGVDVELAVIDRLGEPVTGATVKMIAFHKGRANNRLARTLRGAGRGRHRGLIPGPRPGTWRLIFEITHGEDRVVRSLTREIALAKPARAPRP